MPKITDIELKEMTRIHGWPHDMAIELLTVRERGPVLEAEVKRLYDENLALKATLRNYVDLQTQMIDEKRKMETSKVILLTIEIGQETDGRWIAEVLEIPGAMAYGHTREEATDAAKILAATTIKDRIEHGEPAFQVKK